MRSFQKFMPLLMIGFMVIGCNPVPTSQPEVSPTKLDVDFSNIIVSLTFDDGDADNYLIRSALKDNDLRATFYVISGLTGTDGYMTVEQLHDLYEDGNEIGGHTLNHASLSEVKGAELRNEVCQDRVNLLTMGFEVTSFAYPFGYYDDEAIRAVQSCGYNNARIVADGPQELPIEHPFTLEAMPYIVQDTSFQKMTRYVSDVVREEGGGWMIYVFHHVCNDCDQYAVDYDTFIQFADWLGYQQEVNKLKVQTIHEVIGGAVHPAVAP